MLSLTLPGLVPPLGMLPDSAPTQPGECHLLAEKSSDYKQTDRYTKREKLRERE